VPSPVCMGWQILRPALSPDGFNLPKMTAPLAHPRALAFDVFGTVVDWHRGVSAEAAAMAARHDITLDSAAFANAWRAGYPLAMDRVRRGELPWTRIDALHRLILDVIVDAHGLGGLSDAERTQLNRAWHRLPAWPDTVAGLSRLKRHFTLTTLSNGNMSLLTAMAKCAGLPWDCIISAELFGHYKPDLQTYLGCARLLDLAPAEVMMVACHPSDLRAARGCGLRTAYVSRPLEYGAGSAHQPEVAAGEFDFMAADFNDLATQLGAA
jgi:2-haloacid dehalogenase